MITCPKCGSITVIVPLTADEHRQYAQELAEEISDETMRNYIAHLQAENERMRSWIGRAVSNMTVINGLSRLKYTEVYAE